MNNIKQLIEKSRKSPELAPIYAMELDRQLRSMAQAPLTFSAKALGDVTRDKIRALGLNKIFDSLPSQQSGGIIYHAEMVAKQGKNSEAIAYAFLNANGSEVNALNLLYANHASTNPKLRLYFMNKYLASYGLEIQLEEGDAKDFFHSIKSKKSSTKVDGPLVSVIMPVHNAEGTIELAVGSMLNQTWHNLQIIIVDDASNDVTLQKVKELAKQDPRIQILTSHINVGPYVCRNLGLLHARGQWLTVHDADDWAFPDRIEQQVNALTKANALACTGRMLRINEQGQITRPVSGVSNSEDGYLRLCFVSLMVQTNYFRNQLGAWDSVRVGGDAELIDRLKPLGTTTTDLHQPVMLCLDHEACLTNHKVFGLTNETGQTQPMRVDYKNAFSKWHKTLGIKKLFPFGKARPFEAPIGNSVDQDSIKKAFATWTYNLDLIKASELFDAGWYLSQYPEVEQSGLEAAEHYLVFGNTGATDPSLGFSSRFYLLSRSLKTNPLVHYLRGKDGGPNPKRVLLAAAEVAKTGLHERGIALAEAHLPDELAYTVHVLKANEALDKGNEEGWTENINSYLAHFNVNPICLEAGEGTVFDRLNTSALPPITEGPLVTIIMPAWNAEKTVRKAAQSILNQTWRNLELLVVDDASSDSTWMLLQQIANSDPRVKIFRNNNNVGPYVSKNIALMQSKGKWITGHDADDWAHPQRIEKHLSHAVHGNHPVSTAFMLRIMEQGNVNYFSSIGDFSPDGAARVCSISTLFSADFMRTNLGFWDSVRYGADSELLGRAKRILNNKSIEFNSIAMLCLDLPSSLSNDSSSGIKTITGLSSNRKNYIEAGKIWHQKAFTKDLYIDFNHHPRKFYAPEQMIVSPESKLPGKFD